MLFRSWGEVSSKGDSLNLLSRLLSKKRTLGLLVVNSDLAPKLEGGAEKQKEPLAWIHRNSRKTTWFPPLGMTLACAVSASNTLDQLGLDPGSSLEISYRA